MSARGYSLVELLIAVAIAVTVLGALFAMLASVHGAVERALERADLDAGARALLIQVTTDLRQAGSDAAVAPADLRLGRVLPAVTPLRDVDSNDVQQPGAAIRIAYAAHPGAQGVLASAARAGDTLLRLDTAARCATGPPACGFQPGTAAVIYSASRAQTFLVASIASGTIGSATPFDAFPIGAAVTELVSITYGLRTSGGGDRVVRITAGGAEQPLLDNVVQFDVTTDAADPRDARLVSVALRVQAGAEHFRGPVGDLFTRAGTATHARRWVPDVALRGAIALRSAAPVP